MRDEAPAERVSPSIPGGGAEHPPGHGRAEQPRRGPARGAMGTIPWREKSIPGGRQKGQSPPSAAPPGRLSIPMEGGGAEHPLGGQQSIPGGGNRGRALRVRPHGGPGSRAPPEHPPWAARPRPHSPPAEVAGSRRCRCRRCRPALPRPLRHRPRPDTPRTRPRAATPLGEMGSGGSGVGVGPGAGVLPGIGTSLGVGSPWIWEQPPFGG